MSELQIGATRLFQTARPVKDIKSGNKYIRFAQRTNWGGYRVIRLSDVVPFIKQLPERPRSMLLTEGEVIVIGNIVARKVVYCLLRSMKQKKTCVFGDSRTVPYGLGYFPKDFKYGTPILLTEGPFDRDVVQSIYPL